MVVTLEWVRDNYDVNKSRYIEKNEKDSAFDDWTAGTIQGLEFMAISDAYDHHTLLPTYGLPAYGNEHAVSFILPTGATLTVI